MRLKIHTFIPVQYHPEIRDLVTFAFRGVRDAGVQVDVRFGDGFSARALDAKEFYLPGVARSVRQWVEARIQRDFHTEAFGHAHYPFTYTPVVKRGTAPTVTFTKWQDELVFNLGTQAENVRSLQNDRRLSEVRAARHGAKVLARHHTGGITSDELMDRLARTIVSLRPATTIQ